MKIYTIEKSSTEKIEFRDNDPSFALVHRKIRPYIGDEFVYPDVYKTIIMNKRGVLNLYIALGEVIRKQQEGENNERD